MTEEWATYGVVTDAHRRRSIRLKGYDYSQPGANFVTIVTQDRLCLFGMWLGRRCASTRQAQWHRRHVWTLLASDTNFGVRSLQREFGGKPLPGNSA